MRLGDRCGDFIHAQRRHPGVGIATHFDAACAKLDVIDAILDLSANLLDDRLGTIDADAEPTRRAPVAGERIDHAAGWADDLAGRNHARAAHLACRNGIADGNGHVADRAYVAHSSVAGVEHQPGIHNGIDRRSLNRTAIDLLKAAEAAVDEMHMAVDEPWQHGLSGKVDDALISTGLAIGRHWTSFCNPPLA